MKATFFFADEYILVMSYDVNILLLLRIGSSDFITSNYLGWPPEFKEFAFLKATPNGGFSNI